MRKITKIILALGIFSVMSGCASSLMMKAPSQQVAPPSAGKAIVVFMRPSHVLGAVSVELFDVTDGEIKPMGGVGVGSKVAYETTPGKKVFMAYGTAADFMVANLAPDKTYYAIVSPNWGTGGFAPIAIRNRKTAKFSLYSADFIKWRNGTELTIPKPGLDKWFAENKTKMRGIYTDYWARWQRKSPNAKSQRTMDLQDGR